VCLKKKNQLHFKKKGVIFLLKIKEYDDVINVRDKRKKKLCDMEEK